VEREPERRGIAAAAKERTLEMEQRMKHIKTLSMTRADAFNNFLNDIWVAWQNFRFDKKNEMK